MGWGTQIADANDFSKKRYQVSKTSPTETARTDPKQEKSHIRSQSQYSRMFIYFYFSNLVRVPVEIEKKGH